jgi:hypothetical protein
VSVSFRDTPARTLAVSVIGVALLLGPAPMALRAVGSDAANTTATTSGTATGDSQPRLFDHARHRGVRCTECHGSGAQHRTFLVKSVRDCATCHHERRRDLPCRSCHDTAGPAAEIRVTTPMHLSPVVPPASRVLPFRHDRHTGSGRLECRECHDTDVTLVRQRECASCHASHHKPEGTCATCHTAPRAGVHSVAVHLSCAGSSCHRSERAPSPTLSRELCLACHPNRRAHEPGGSCAACHLVPPAEDGRVGTSTSGTAR